MKTLKKVLALMMILAMTLASLVSCGSQETSEQKFEEFTNVSDMLYEVTYDEYSSEIPDESKCKLLAGDLGCSGVRNGDFVGRNFDYIMNECPTFVVRTTAKDGRYATLGVGRLAKINSEKVEAGLSEEQIDILPWGIVDGINEKGLVANCNVVPRADWGEVPHTGTNPDGQDLNANYIVRAVLDNCATTDEVVEYLGNYNVTPLDSELFDLHIMFSDSEKTIVVEFINNKIVAEEQYIMTNYFLNMDKMPDYTDGIERVKILKENYDEGKTMDGMYNLMQRVKYTNAYDPAYEWYSELGYTNSEMKEKKKELKERLYVLQDEFKEELEYIEKNGYRESTDWWDTTHNSVYDMANKRVWITVHERYDEKPFEFTLQ